MCNASVFGISQNCVIERFHHPNGNPYVAGHIPPPPTLPSPQKPLVPVPMCLPFGQYEIISIYPTVLCHLVSYWVDPRLPRGGPVRPRGLGGRVNGTEKGPSSLMPAWL